MDKAKLEAFLLGYKELCNEHGLLVDSCGCCGSPWVVEIAQDRSIAETVDAAVQHLRKETVVTCTT